MNEGSASAAIAPQGSSEHRFEQARVTHMVSSMPQGRGRRYIRWRHGWRRPRTVDDPSDRPLPPHRTVATA